MTREARDAPQFYLTAPSACPYLPGQQERKIFTHLVGKRAAALNDLLTQTGFRRSQTIAYRPACESCRACVSVRVLVDDFRPSRQPAPHACATNADLLGAFVTPKPTNEHYVLFRSYLDARHPEGGMADMSSLDFAMMVEDTHIDTVLTEYRAAERNRRPAGSGPPARGLPDRPARRRPVAGLFVLRSRRRPPVARQLHHSRPYREGAPPRPAPCLSRLLGRGVEEDGLQGRLPAAGAPRPARLGAGRAVGGAQHSTKFTAKTPGSSPCIWTACRCRSVRHGGERRYPKDTRITACAVQREQEAAALDFSLILSIRA